MLTAIKGTYSNGRIILHETPPIEEQTEVIVTFLEKEGSKHTRRGGSMKGEVRMADKTDSLDSNGVQFGSLAGKVGIPADFNDPLDDLKDYM